MFFRILSFGCKVNQCDSAGLAQSLAARGWRPAPAERAPDLALVNTCTVTARADQQARQAIRRLAREHPETAIWVTGCYAQRAPEEVAALPGVAGVAGNREKARLAELISGPAPASPGIWVGAPGSGEPFHPWPIHPYPGQTRARLKIQEGCSHGCTYCIVPQVRGPRRSLAPREAAAALDGLARLGYQEVVLTGVDLGQYGQDEAPPGSLADLVHRLRGRVWPFRVRLSSLEPQGVTPALLSALRGWPEFCPHFHLPLQSGAASVLADMGRPYAPQDFRELAAAITRQFPEAALGLDVLVGFPGETPGDFEASCAVVAALPVTYLHVFPFSPRPGTAAAQMTPVPTREIRARARVMRELGQVKKGLFMQAQVGKVREVLVEGPAPEPGWLKALSDNYLLVLLPGPPEWRNRRLRVRFLQVKGELLVGAVAGGEGQF
jgi:threonylcarbamoyladenosine tRNA methylthiotransferase MtaB